jgi:hypothetical protein
MAKELPYFKFNVSEWILGRISDQSDKVQGAFIIAICHYWHKKCDCFIPEFKKKIGKTRYDLLLKLKFIEEKNKKVLIEFLDEQFNELSDIHGKRIKSGQAGGIASAKAKEVAKVKHLDKDKEEDKEEDKEKDKDNKEIILSFISQTKEMPSWIQTQCMQNKINNPDNLMMYWEQFLLDMANRHKLKNDLKAMQSTFTTYMTNKWIRVPRLESPATNF